MLSGLLLVTAMAARADPLRSLPPAIGTTGVVVSDELTGLGLRGFDAVTYFLGSAPKPGKDGVELVWSGVVWRFAHEGNRDAFARDPNVYAPRIGGYDATAAAVGTLLAADPAVFLVRGHRLYLFRSTESRARFQTDPSLAARAEERWPEFSRDLVKP